MHECPNCGSDHTKLSKNSWLMVCQDCGHKAHPERFRIAAINSEIE